MTEEAKQKIARPELGQALVVRGIAFRKKEYPILRSGSRGWRFHKATWIPKVTEAREVVYMGYRFKQNGSVEYFYEEQAHFKIESVVEVWMVVENPREDPFYVFPDQCDFIVDGDMENPSVQWDSPNDGILSKRIE